MSTNNLTNNDIVINDGKLKYHSSKITEPVSKKLIVDKLYCYFKTNQTEADKIIEHIFNNREKKVKTNVKKN